jgi:hypothetical protein
LEEALQSNKLAFLLELAIVFGPLYVGLVMSERLGSNLIQLGGNTVIMGGPLAYLGV